MVSRVLQEFQQLEPEAEPQRPRGKSKNVELGKLPIQEMASDSIRRLKHQVYGFTIPLTGAMVPVWIEPGTFGLLFLSENTVAAPIFLVETLKVR